ncbi:MAG TPA: polysaccharide biosynthesis C-terminal domain-containing protein [Solirubrobacterales bacterium]|nr:polysaccharide biosynthesis C-terminal domain-containing protein [Solirubrobacterales bacterium]
MSFGALSFVASALLAIASSIIVARIYGIAVIGQFALVSAPAAVVWFLSNAGEQVASVRLLVGLPRRHPRITGIFFVVFSFSMVLTTVVGLLVLVATYFLLNGPVHHPGLFGAAAVNTLGCIFVSNVAWNLETPFTAFMAGRELFWIRLAQPIVFIIVAAGLSFVETDVWALVIATIASWGFSLLHRAFAIRPFVDLRPRAKEIREATSVLPEILSFGIRIVPGMLATGVAYEVGIWILGASQSISAVGAYSRAWNVIRRFIEVNWRVAEMLFPSLLQRREQEDSVGFARAALDTMRYVLFLALLPAAVGGGGAEPVMAIFGPGFRQAGTAFAILLLAPGLSLLQTVQEIVLLAKERPTAVSIASIGQMLATVILTVVLTPRLGINGPAIGMLAGYAAVIAYQQWSLHGNYGAPVRTFFPARHLLGVVAAYAVAFAVSRLLADAIGSEILALVAIAIVGTLTYLATFLLICRPLPRDRERLRSLIDDHLRRREVAPL